MNEAQRAYIAKIQNETAQEEAANVSEVPDQSMLTGLVDSFTQGAAMGFGDEATGVEAALLGRTPEGGWFDYSKPIGERYRAAVDAERTQQATFSEAHPVASTAAEIGGALSTGMGAARAGATFIGRAPTLARNIGLGAIEGGGYGATYAAGSATEGNRLAAMPMGGLTGAVGGGLLTAGGGGLARWLQRRKYKAEAPSRETLRTSSREAYKRAEGAGVVFSEEATEALATGLIKDLKNAGFDSSLHPKAAAALARINEKAGQAISLEDLEILRRVAGQAGKSIEPSERMVAGILIDGIDDLVENAMPRMVASGASDTAAAALREARGLWARTRKSELLTDAIEKAKLQASGFENGLRTQFRALANNKKAMRGFSADEQRLIQKVAMGGPIENLLKLIGKFSFGSGGATNALGGSIGAGAGYAAGGPIGSIAVPTVAYGARRGSEAMTRGNATLAEALVRGGGQALPEVRIPPALAGAGVGAAGYSGGTATEPQGMRAALLGLKRRR